MHLSYKIAWLRGFAAFPLYASSIRDPQRAALRSFRPAACLRTGRAPAPRCRFQHLNYLNYRNSHGSPTDRGYDREEPPGSLSETSCTADGSAGTVRWLRRARRPGARISPAVSSALASSFRWHKATSAPSAAKANAVARPIPREPPVRERFLLQASCCSPTNRRRDETGALFRRSRSVPSGRDAAGGAPCHSQVLRRRQVLR